MLTYLYIIIYITTNFWDGCPHPSTKRGVANSTKLTGCVGFPMPGHKYLCAYWTHSYTSAGVTVTQLVWKDFKRLPSRIEVILDDLVWKEKMRMPHGNSNYCWSRQSDEHCTKQWPLNFDRTTYMYTHNLWMHASIRSNYKVFSSKKVQTHCEQDCMIGQ